MARRPAREKIARGKTREDMELCEEEGDGNHIVKPNIWPPPRTGATAGDPYLTENCTVCGCNLIVYEGHATGQIEGITVVLPERKTAGRTGPVPAAAS